LQIEKLKENKERRLERKWLKRSRRQQTQKELQIMSLEILHRKE